MNDIDTQLNAVAWDANGLAPAIVQDARSGEVRMLGFVSRESLGLTIETGFVHFFSRSRQKIWKKGETSGNVLEVVEVRVDCDNDTLLIRAIPHGPTCHTGADNCFYQEPIYSTGTPDQGAAILDQIADIVAARKRHMPEGSYTTYLFEQGIDKIGKKIGEESAEVIIAAKNGHPEPLAGEAADLLYHLLVMLQASDVPLSDVWRVLEERHVPKTGTST
ncbi:bifunctional phosphoribosyl-AMP cyclohydrolase/phosphoribosyl-ATP diphosphatase HisIE [soil metagenome]